MFTANSPKQKERKEILKFDILKRTIIIKAIGTEKYDLGYGG